MKKKDYDSGRSNRFMFIFPPFGQVEIKQVRAAAEEDDDDDDYIVSFSVSHRLNRWN